MLHQPHRHKTIGNQQFSECNFCFDNGRLVYSTGSGFILVQKLGFGGTVWDAL